jgi:hypothetical protein
MEGQRYQSLVSTEPGSRRGPDFPALGPARFASLLATALVLGASLNIQPMLAQHEGHHPTPSDVDSTPRHSESMIMPDSMSMPMGSMTYQTDSMITADSMPMSMPMGSMHDMLVGPLGISHARMGSGTSWIPDASPMDTWDFVAGPWRLMAHGSLNLMYDDQFGRRGDQQVSSPNWGMLMAMRPLGGGLLHLHAMLTAEPWTVGGSGYPLPLQTGESYQGKPIHDRQHPHDLFMELSAMYEHALGANLGVFAYLAPVGEPALGPTAFMHRPSAQTDPLAPLAHHWQDVTHISYGVVTTGVYSRTLKLEASVFNGREPDEHRANFEFGALDSYSGRLSWNPGPRWSLSASYGYLKGPEAARRAEFQHRIVGSVFYTRPLGKSGEWASGLIYGGKYSGRDGLENSLGLETNAQVDDRNTVFGRLTYVRKSAEELVVTDAQPGAGFDLSSIVLGYLREVAKFGGATLGLGVRGSLNLLPAGLERTYGTRTPSGVVFYARLRPAQMQ